jgi:hypothetical protein
MRWPIRTWPPTAPVAVIVIGAARSPVPTPSAPSPGLVGHQQGANANSHAERNQRRANDDGGGRANVNDGGIVLRDIHDLRASRLDHVDGRATGLLHLYGLLLIAAQVARVVGLSAQALNRGGHRSLVRRKRLADGGVIVDVLGHHLQDLRKINEGDERGIEPLLRGGICERSAGEIEVLLQPVIHVEDFLRIRGGGGDLGEQGIRIERYRGQQLVQLGRSGERVLRRKNGREVLQNERGDQERNDD